MDVPVKSDSRSALRVLFPIAGFVVGLVFWTVVQRVTPAFSNWVVDVFVVPVAASAVVGLIAFALWRPIRISAVAFVAGTTGFAIAYTVFIVYGSSPSMY